MRAKTRSHHQCDWHLPWCLEEKGQMNTNLNINAYFSPSKEWKATEEFTEGSDRVNMARFFYWRGVKPGVREIN